MRFVFVIILISLVSLGMRAGATAQTPSPSPTEAILSKITIVKDDQARVFYKKQRDPKDFATAQRCVTRGLEEIEHAITLTPNSESAWLYRAHLLLERSKLLEMEGKLNQKAEFERQAEAARQRALQLKAEPEPDPGPEPSR